MTITIQLNGRPITADVSPDTLLLDFVRAQGCASVKCGCATAG